MENKKPANELNQSDIDGIIDQRLKPNDNFLPIAKVGQMTGRKESATYSDPTFPRPIKISSRKSVWVESEVRHWMEARARNENPVWPEWLKQLWAQQRTHAIEKNQVRKVNNPRMAKATKPICGSVSKAATTGVTASIGAA
ncbi:MAG: AlpA family phage regulatory protein [Candidatus Methylumidiphilus sp.]